ncbi:MAG: bifunctional UDP-N-acetylmuramoyl-tripeptide:D-alanyl-D-alanine ligase/alanine racemase [Bacteroidales bacterium]|jgi:alanine racemase
MTPYSISDIARITGAQLSGPVNGLISKIHTDTRRIDQTTGSLFVALIGPNHDGHRFIREAYDAGIRVFLVSHSTKKRDTFEQATVLTVHDTLVALQQLAQHHRSTFTGQLIAITGSNGKTIIKEWLAQILSATATVSKSPKSFNSRLGVPLSVMGINPDDTYAVMEAGISEPGEMNTLEEILKPNAGIISNMGSAHQENFADYESKVREKLILFKNCQTIYFCQDHKLIFNALQTNGLPGRQVNWSRLSDADLQILEEQTNRSTTSIKALYQSAKINIRLPFADPASIENLIHIWLVLLDLGFSNDFIQKQIDTLEPIRMRLEQKAGINGCTLINDFYNSDVLSLKIALDLLFQQTLQKKKSLIISDILQTGLPENELYREISSLLENRNLHQFIGIGPAICRNRDLFTKPITCFLSTSDYLTSYLPGDFSHEAILLKGARMFQFERISRVLEEKLHATVLEISMNDVRHNLNYFRSKLLPDTRLMVMVKAFSYGSGGVEMARFLANERVDYLGVAFSDEGIDLRRAGIKIPIMVMNPDFSQSDLIADYNLEPEIYHWHGLQEFSRMIRSLGIPSYPVHIKLDTGMHRLGFPVSETEELASYLAEHRELTVKSLFSHLAAAEDPKQDLFTQSQINFLKESSDLIMNKLGYPIIRHILNSSGIERFPNTGFEMVRLGIGLYGFQNSGQQETIPIATLKTTISQIRYLEAGESVGYGRGTILAKPATIAVIPVGYADGIDRRLGNGKYRMIVNGQHAPTIGHICMDMTMLDISGIETKEGDEVIVFGPANPVTGLAKLLGTIPYEILTSIPSRVKRIYLFD